MAHELAHHLLGHVVSRRDKRLAKASVDRSLRESGAITLTSAMSTSQRQEIESDILGFLLVAESVSEPGSFPNMYRAMLGSIIGLVSLAHLTGSWISINGDSHPGFHDRFAAISMVTRWLASGSPAAGAPHHPLGLLDQLSGFCAIALRHWLSRESQDYAFSDVIAVISHLLDLSETRVKSPGQSA